MKRFAIICVLLCMTLLAACHASIQEETVVSSPVPETTISVPTPTLTIPEPTAVPVTGVIIAGKNIPFTTQQLQLTVAPDDIPLLDQLSDLEEITLDGSSCYAEILNYMESHPQVSVHYTVDLCGMPIPCDAISAELDAADLDVASFCTNISYLPVLSTIRFLNFRPSPDDFSKLTQLEGITLEYDVSFAGLTVANDIEGLDLCNVPSNKTAEISAVLHLLPQLKWICLNPASHQVLRETEPATEFLSNQVAEMLLDGSEPSFTWSPDGVAGTAAASWKLEQVKQLQSAKPGLIVDFPVSRFGIQFSLADETLTLSGIKMKPLLDELRDIVPVMTNCRLIEMENCGISNEEMAALRDELVPANVVWNIKCGPYTCRTDALMIKFAGKAQVLDDKHASALQYCTKVRYLDLGHNHIRHIDFVTNMPDLEVVILSINYIIDISPLANCKKIEYCELLCNLIPDLSPLSELSSIQHLNIANNRLNDLSPIFSFDKLERAWISRNQFSKEQVEQLQVQYPDCEINTTAHDETDQGWRKKNGELAPRYALLREQFVYSNSHIRSYYLKNGKIMAYNT